MRPERTAIGASIITNSFLGVPYYNYSIMGPKPDFAVKASILDRERGPGESEAESPGCSKVTSIVQSLCRYCTGTPVARVLNKFAPGLK